MIYLYKLKSLFFDNKVVVNTLSNYLSKLWAIVSVYLFIPFYIDILGIDSYGIITFQAVILSFIYIADGGLSSAFSRECAKSNVHGGLNITLRTIERVIFLVLLFLLIILYLSANWVANSWLGNSGQIDSLTVEKCIELMCVGMLPQILMGLYFGGLMGLEKQAEANLIHVLYGVFRSGFVLVPLYFIPNVEIYFYWYAIVSSIFCFIFRYRLTLNLKGEDKNAETAYSVLKRLAPFSIGMLTLSIMSALINQIDKIFVSGNFKLAELSAYNLASVLSQTPYFLTLPIAIAVLPRITKLIYDGDINAQTELYVRSSILISIISSIVFFNVYFYLFQITNIWIGEKNSTQINELVPFLLLGNLFLSLQLMPFQLSIANGHNKTSVKFGWVNLIIYVPALFYFSSIFGLFGVTLPWFIINIFNFSLLSCYLNYKFYKNGHFHWLITCCFKPILIVFVVIYFGFLLAKHFICFEQQVFTVMYSIFVAIIAFSISYFFNFNHLAKESK